MKKVLDRSRAAQARRTLTNASASALASAVGAASMFALVAFGAAPFRTADDSIEAPSNPPFGLPEAFVDPADNAFTPERFALGRRLFFDPALSLDRSVSCASCHKPEHHFADTTPTSLGVGGQRTERNTPTVFNRGFAPRQMWDGRAGSLEEQALIPIANPIEMALPIDEALERLRADASYSSAFAAAYDGGVTRENLARALAAFVRRLAYADSAVDRFRLGETTWLSKRERTGMWLFESRGQCWRCHSGPNLSDEGFHNTGVGVRDGAPEAGRAAITNDGADLGKFKTATLRGLAFTAPYMHDGSAATLEDVVRFYERGGGANSALDPLLEPFELNEEERASLVAFLGALSRSGPPPEGADD